MKSILLLMDDARSQKLYGRILERCGFRVWHASRGLQAWTLLTDEPLDLVVVDSILADEDGGTFIRRLRDDHPSPDVRALPLVYLAPDLADDPPVGGCDLPVDLLVRRPVGPLELAQQIEQLLGGPDADAATAAAADTVRHDTDRPDTDGPAPFGRECESLQHEFFAAATPRPASGGTTGNARILVVDPDLRFLAGLTQMGEHYLIDVSTACTPAEAVAQLERFEFDGIMLTVAADAADTVPETLRRLREATVGIPPAVALVCERREKLDRAQGLYAGAALILQKPIDDAAFSRAAHHLASLRRAGQTSVLVADADTTFVEATRDYLRPLGYTVREATTQHDLLVDLERTSADVLLLDAAMPRLDALALCRHLRSMPRWQDLTIMLVSNRLSARERVAAFDAGADDYLVKPVLPEELAARLKVRVERMRVLRDRADRDMLTGLLTRRAFVEQFAGRLAEVSRHNRPLAFCLLDLDHFKRINDTYGHLAGDRVLATLGHLLASRFRLEDLRARWGGEEFAVVLVNEDQSTARHALQRVINEFSRIEFESDDGERFKVTFSAGIAEFPRDGADPETLLRTADMRMLQAKRSGRNCILARHP